MVTAPATSTAPSVCEPVIVPRRRYAAGGCRQAATGGEGPVAGGGRRLALMGRRAGRVVDVYHVQGIGAAVRRSAPGLGTVPLMSRVAVHGVGGRDAMSPCAASVPVFTLHCSERQGAGRLSVVPAAIVTVPPRISTRKVCEAGDRLAGEDHVLADAAMAPER